jgi:hypothetical protein
MKFLTRIRTFKDRLKLRLIEDKLHDLERDMVLAQGPAWVALAGYQHRVISAQLAIQNRLDAELPAGDEQAMGNLEIAGTVLLAVSLAVAVAAALPGFLRWAFP